MVPLWPLGVCLGGLHLPQTYGVPADSEAALADIIIEDPSGLVERDYLYGDSSGIQHSEDLDSNDDDLQKSALKKCGTVPMVAHGSSKVLQRKATYTCKEGYALLGNESIICDAEGQWSQAPLCLPTPKFFPGPKVEPGDPGLMGAKGEPGDAGAMGPIGPPGIAGRKGVRGARGPSGIPGTRGGTGPPGLPGPGGANGRKGLNGAKGIDGDPGATGPPGPQGSQGEPGYKGEPGDPGDPGAPGLSITWSRSAFCVKLGTGSVVNNQAIGFQEILYNEESDYNIANSIFVCRVAGVYAFHAYFEVNTRNAQIAIMVNDQRIYHNYQSYSSYPELSTVGTIVRLKVGDKVWIQPIDSDTGICRNSYFMGYLIYDSK